MSSSLKELFPGISTTGHDSQKLGMVRLSVYGDWH